eukprot:gene9784-2110_t
MNYPLLTHEEVLETPSKKNGISSEEEKKQRIYGCQLIQRASMLLRLPQAVIVRAQILFHRFYMVVSMKEFDVILACLGCIFLASKLEENLRKVFEIISVVYRIIQRENDNVESFAKFDILKLKEKVVFAEQYILQKIAFSLSVDCPHKFILIYINIVGGDQKLAQKSWNFLNDSILTTLPLEFPAESIACSSIYCAALELNIKLPESPAWYELFDVSKEQLEYMKKEIFTLYKIGKVSYIDFDSTNNISHNLPFKQEKRKREDEMNSKKKQKF